MKTKQKLAINDRLCIIAGQGGLPASVVSACIDKGIDFFILAIDGFTDKNLVKDYPHAWVRLGAIGQALNILHRENVKKLVMAGKIRRPSIKELRPDMRGMAFFAKIGMKALGDDGFLKAVIQELEKEGFEIIGSHEICDDLTVKAGDISKYPPRKYHMADIRHGWKILEKISELDIGQAVVVQNGIVLGVEAVEGTDELIKRTANLKKKAHRPTLIKRAKINQELKIDMPTIGFDTVKNAITAGFAGIAFEAEKTIFLDREKAIELADKSEFFLTSIDREDIYE